MTEEHLHDEADRLFGDKRYREMWLLAASTIEQAREALQARNPGTRAWNAPGAVDT